MPPIVVAAAVVAAGAVAAGAASASASKKAAKTQASAAKKASAAEVQAAQVAARSQEKIARENLAQQQQQFDQGREDVRPWRDAGALALNTLVQGFQPAGTAAGQQGTQQSPLRITAGPFAGWDLLQGATSGDVVVRHPTGGIQATLENPAEVRDYLTPAQQPAPLSGGEFNRPFTLADFQQDPGYAFRVSEGQKALERSAAARGGVLSGAHLKDIERFGQQLGAEEYQNAFNRYQADLTGRYNRLAGVAQTGQVTATTLASLGSQQAAQASTTLNQLGQSQYDAAIRAGQARSSGYQNVGNAQASGIIGQANAFNQGIGTISNAAQTYLLLNQLKTPALAGV